MKTLLAIIIAVAALSSCANQKEVVTYRYSTGWQNWDSIKRAQQEYSVYNAEQPSSSHTASAGIEVAVEEILPTAQSQKNIFGYTYGQKMYTSDFMTRSQAATAGLITRKVEVNPALEGAEFNKIGKFWIKGSSQTFVDAYNAFYRYGAAIPDPEEEIVIYGVVYGSVYTLPERR